MPKTASSKNDDTKHARYRQIAAVPVRLRDGMPEICLITTRETQRWTVPKGWPMKGLKDYAAAAMEAREEAGLEGKISKQVLGTYLYWKRRAAHFDLVEVAVYRLDVESELEQWREKGQRDVRWLPAREAANLVEETGLSALIADL